MVQDSGCYRQVGVIGGGQLAWMMAAGAAKLGLELRVQTPHMEDPAGAIAEETFLGAIQDVGTTQALAAHSEVITFENEFVDLEALEALAQQGVRFAPSLSALRPLLDKAEQRAYFQRTGLPTPMFLALGDVPAADRGDWQNPFGFPVVLKARRLGYDGQGTTVIKTAGALQQILDAEGFEPFLLEEFIPFERELAVMAARSASGEVVVYPVVETRQVQQVCRWVIAPAAVSPRVQAAVTRMAETLLQSLEVVGVFGLELFQQGDRILINETAPRTHNSGHYSLDACKTSQFEQQLRAVCGFPLGSAEMTVPGAVMVNLLGFEAATDNYEEKRKKLAEIPNAHVYWYGKKQSRPRRKLGHVTVTLTEADPQKRQRLADEAIAQIDSLWPPLV